MIPRLTFPALFLCLATPLAAQLSNVPAWEAQKAPAGSPLPCAMTLRANNASYIRSVTLVRPEPITTADELTGINPHLSRLLPGFTRLLNTAEVSSRYSELYERKLQGIRRGELLTSHNYFDCQTVLRLRYPSTGRRVLLLQADMDVVTDGSDPLRASALADYDLARSSDWYLPETSYSWARGSSPKQNPFLQYYPEALTKLQELRTQLVSEAERDGGVVWREMLKTCDAQIHRLRMRGMGRGTRTGLGTRRYLLATRDPFVVLPAPWVNQKAEWSPRIGDYAAVIYKDRIYPAILGDSGPSNKVGEASLLLARQLNPRADGKTRAVSDLAVTYLFFPRSSGPRGEPDLTAWRESVRNLLDQIGGIGDGTSLHDWSTPAP